MKKWMVMSMVAVTVAVQPALADEGRDRHYEHAAAQPGTVEGARRLLKSTADEMAKYVQEKDYEKVHEASYSLENAVKLLKNASKSSEIAKKQLELIELYTNVVHHGSEDERFDKVHRYFPALRAEIDAYLGESH